MSIEKLKRETFLKMANSGEIAHNSDNEKWVNILIQIGADFMQKEYEEKLRWIPVSEFDFEQYGSEFVLLKDSEKAIPVIKQVLTQDDLQDYLFFRLIEI